MEVDKRSAANIEAAKLVNANDFFGRKMEPNEYEQRT